MNALTSSSSINTQAPRRLRILVRGAVQGVGFRPFVYRHATDLGLSGWVSNDGEGVTIEVEGAADALDRLITQVKGASPPAHIDGVETREIPSRGVGTFEIRASILDGARTAPILPDLATCDDCLRELFDAGDRRHLYPFINCTQCGPRYSIIVDTPYDRARTSMRSFEMCAECRAEYEDPASRRFHAEPIACPICGPKLSLWDARGNVFHQGKDCIGAAGELIMQGKILAIKGIGGFHLTVDAKNEDAVRRLRQRKHRPDKPFAVMFANLAAAKQSCRISAIEEALLAGYERPIVLLRKRDNRIAPTVAPHMPTVGAILPYSPVHHLLLRAHGRPMVATSGNLNDEPIAIDESEALERLGGIADAFLVHDRPILRAAEDSVARVVDGRSMLLRRGRGYAPAPIDVPDVEGGILALGGHLKTTIALTRPGHVILGPHVGDLETASARVAHERSAQDLCRLFHVQPQAIARDLHPDYATSREAHEMDLPVRTVQHHIAHIAACLAEHGSRPPALGVAWDGAGYGPDGTIWGGEFLLLSPSGWRRAAHLRAFRIPGGEAAMHEPRRSALGLLYEAFGPAALEMTQLAPVRDFTAREREILKTALDHHINALITTSAGRLFDAFAALAGLCQRASYEGQAASLLEWLASASQRECYTFEIRKSDTSNGPLIVDWLPALMEALEDIRTGRGADIVSAAFHNGLAAAIESVATRLGQERIVLTGGCFQNVRLAEAAIARLRARGFKPLWHERVPPNDGGLALGQAAWAGWQLAEGGARCA